MEHLAIMKKSWKLIPKILTGEKKVESRWYKSKYPPGDNINSGDVVYFKDSGEPVNLRAEVVNVIQFSDLAPNKIKKILNQYGQLDGLGITDISKFYEFFKNKKYCILVFLGNPRRIPPFEVDKKRYGIMTSWIVIDDINKIKK